MTMSFGSTKPTPESQTVLQLQWDCRQNKSVACQLTNSWIARTDGTVLDEEERRTIAKTFRIETSEVTRKLEKKRYDKEGLCIGNGEAQLSLRRFLILFHIIYYRAQVGLTTSLTSNLSTTTMPLMPLITKRDLVRLPVEIRIEILCHFPNLRTLLSAVLTHFSIYKTYKGYSRIILLAIFRQCCEAIRGYEIGEVFRELIFAIRHDFIDGDVAQELFTLGWNTFRTKNLEDVLFPLGRALALSYSHDRRDDAVKLLRELANCSGPFSRSDLPLDQSLQFYAEIVRFPVLRLLGEWTREGGELHSYGPEGYIPTEYGRAESVREAIEMGGFTNMVGFEDLDSPLCFAVIRDISFEVALGNAYEILSDEIDMGNDGSVWVALINRGQPLPKPAEDYCSDSD